VSFPRSKTRFIIHKQTVQDLAARFADGRLSTDELLQASDEKLAEMLTQVRGIGRVIIFVLI
jgi:3-methyladenine DNA glycosylase/8-oxoguanine DNA glycosylase